MMLDELDYLQSTIVDTLNTIRLEIKANNLPHLSHLATTPHPLDSDSFVCPPRLYEARRLALAAMGQLKNLLQVPYEKVVEQSCAVYDTACLDLLVQSGVLDRLAEESTLVQGMSVQQLQEHSGIDSGKLNTVLRYLAAQGWLREPTEGTYALTRSALELRVGNNGRKWIMTPGKPKVASALHAQLTHPEWRFSRAADQTAFQIANQTPLTLFAWMKQNPSELVQWASSVQSLGNAYHSAITNDIPWDKYNGNTFIDCGGGQGNLSISIAEILPKSFFVVQDLEEVVPIANANIAARAPETLKSGRITTEAHNFFEPQPRSGKNHVYLFRYILHDWPDHACIRILNNIARVARPWKCKIIIIDTIQAPCTTLDPSSYGSQLRSLKDVTDTDPYTPIAAPPFIPKNFGACAKMSLALGVHMMGVFNALERSFSEWNDLMTKAGLRIVHVYPLRGMVSAIECEPLGEGEEYSDGSSGTEPGLSDA